MMPFDPDWVAFVGVAAIVVITPGPDMVLVATHALAGGRSAARMAAVGVCTGILVHAAAAVVGLSALLATSSVAFSVVKVVGAVVLIGLGVRTIWSVHRRTVDGPIRSTAESGLSTRAGVSSIGSSPFWQGFWSNVLNPKVALLFLSLLPQFVDPGDGALIQTVVLSGTFLGMGLAWLLAYVAIVTRAAGFLRQDRIRHRLEVVSGVVLVALGLRIAVQDA